MASECQAETTSTPQVTIERLRGFKQLERVAAGNTQFVNHEQNDVLSTDYLVLSKLFVINPDFIPGTKTMYPGLSVPLALSMSTVLRSPLAPYPTPPTNSPSYAPTFYTFAQTTPGWTNQAGIPTHYITTDADRWLWLQSVITAWNSIPAVTQQQLISQDVMKLSGVLK